MNKVVHSFPKGISPKVKVTARLELEHAYFEDAVQYFNLYDTVNPPNRFFGDKISDEQRHSYFKYKTFAFTQSLFNVQL